MCNTTGISASETSNQSLVLAFHLWLSTLESCQMPSSDILRLRPQLQLSRGQVSDVSPMTSPVTLCMLLAIAKQYLFQRYKLDYNAIEDQWKLKNMFQMSSSLFLTFVKRAKSSLPPVSSLTLPSHVTDQVALEPSRDYWNPIQMVWRGSLCKGKKPKQNILQDCFKH